MRFLGFLLASIAFTFTSSTYAQSCYSQQLQSNLSTVYPQTFTTVHTVNVPVQVAVQHQVQTVVQHQIVAADPLPVSQCSQNLGAVYGNAVSSCGAVPLGIPMQSYGHSFNSFRGVNRAVAYGSSFSNFGAVGGVGVVGGTGVSITAQDRRGTQVIANGANNVRIQRGLLGRINGATADRGRGGLLGGLLPF